MNPDRTKTIRRRVKLLTWLFIAGLVLSGATPLLIGYGAIAYWWLDKSWFVGALLGLKTAWIALATQPAVTVFRFSSTTNDTQHVRFRELRLVAAVAAAGLVIFALAATLLFLDGSVAWICGALLPLPSFGFHWFYGRWFDRNRFDLMQQPAPT